jgi:hypothetical protein
VRSTCLSMDRSDCAHCPPLSRISHVQACHDCCDGADKRLDRPHDSVVQPQHHASCEAFAWTGGSTMSFRPELRPERIASTCLHWRESL